MVLPFFSTTISGNQNDEIIGITSTKKNWVVAGNAVGDFLGTTPLGPLGGIDSWVSAFDSAGGNVWSLRVGTSEDDLATAIAVDSKEQIWIAGLAQSDRNPTVLVAPDTSSASVEPQPIQSNQTPTVQTLNPDTVTAQRVEPIRKDLKFITVTQVDKSGVLLNRFAISLSNFGYITAIIPGSAVVYLIGIEITKSGGERSFMQSLTITGEFGRKFYFGKSATTLASGVLNKDKTLTLVGHSAEVLAKKPVIGKVDGIILNVSPADGKILKVVRSNGVGATRAWKSAAGNLTVGGTSLTKNLTEAVISQFSSTGSVLWSKRYAGATAAVNNSSVVAVLSAQTNTLLKAKAGDVVVYQFDKKGEPVSGVLGGRIPLSAEILGLRSQSGLGTCVATRAADGRFVLTQFPF